MNTTVCKLLIKDIYNTEIFNSISCTLYLSIHLHLYIYLSYHPFFISILLKANYIYKISTKLNFQPNLMYSPYLSIHLHSY